MLVKFYCLLNNNINIIINININIKYAKIDRQ